MSMQIRQKSASRLVHSMADVVPSHRAFACYLAYFGHIRSPKKFDAGLYQSGPNRATKIVLGSKQTPSAEAISICWHLPQHDRAAVFPPVREGQKVSASTQCLPDWVLHSQTGGCDKQSAPLRLIRAHVSPPRGRAHGCGQWILETKSLRQYVHAWR